MKFNLIKNTKFFSSSYQVLCLSCIFILVFNEVFSVSFLDVSIIKHFARNLCYLFAAINLILFIKEKNYFITYFALASLFIGIMCKNFSTSNEILQFSLLLLAFSKVNFNKAVFVFIITVGVCTLVIATCASFQLIDENIYSLRDENIRNAFGFRHPNCIGAIIFFLIMSIWVYLKDTIKNNVIILITLLLASCIIVEFIDSRTPLYLSLAASLIIAFLVLAKKFGIIGRFFSILAYNVVSKWLLRSTFILLCVIAFLLGYFYTQDSEIFVYFNDLSSGRLALSHNAIMNLPITLFGQDLNLSDLDTFGISSAHSVSYQHLDSFYLSVLYYPGILSLFVYILAYDVIMKKAVLIRDKKLIVTMFLFALYGISESVFNKICFDIFIFLAFAYQYRKLPTNSIVSRDE